MPLVLPHNHRPHYNRFRYYDPSVGRYVSADSIGQFAKLVRSSVAHHRLVPMPPSPPPIPVVSHGNLFGYVRNNPQTLIDPTGEGPVTFGVCVAIVAGIVAKSLVDIRNLDEQIQQAMDDLSELQERLQDECDPAKQLEIQNELNKMTLDLATTLLTDRATAQATALLGGLGTALCPALLPVGP